MKEADRIIINILYFSVKHFPFLFPKSIKRYLGKYVTHVFEELCIESYLSDPTDTGTLESFIIGAKNISKIIDNISTREQMLKRSVFLVFLYSGKPIKINTIESEIARIEEIIYKGTVEERKMLTVNVLKKSGKVVDFLKNRIKDKIKDKIEFLYEKLKTQEEYQNL
jgi:hypothetical protein